MFKQALKIFKASSDKHILNTHYNKIPTGQCSSCPKCCYDNVPVSAVEFLNILSEVQGDIEGVLKRVKHWYLNQYSIVQPCIFLKDSLCQIYDVRPLSCRLFGHQSAREQAKRVDVVIKSKRQAAKYLKETFNIIVDEKVIVHVIEQCDFIPEIPFKKTQANQLFDTIEGMSSRYYLKGYFDEVCCNLTMIEWFIYAFLDEEHLFEQLLNDIHH